MATYRDLLDLLERAGQLLRKGTAAAHNLTKPELLELAATARALAAGAEAKVEATTLQHHHKSTACDSEEKLAAAAQLAPRSEKASADESDDDFEMGETLSEEERARRAKAKAEREGNVQDISDDVSDVEDGALTPFQQRLLVRYKEFATSEEGLDINDLAELVDLPELRSAVDFLESKGYLYSTIDDDHHKYTWY